MTSTEIAADIADLIARREKGYHPGDKLPSYAELAADYSVSPATMARVIRDLRVRNIVVGSPGRGVFVAER